MEAFVSNSETYLGASIVLRIAAEFAGGVLTSFIPCVCANDIGDSKLRSFPLPSPTSSVWPSSTLPSAYSQPSRSGSSAR